MQPALRYSARWVLKRCSQCGEIVAVEWNTGMARLPACYGKRFTQEFLDILIVCNDDGR
jgi:hypothetical protein